VEYRVVGGREVVEVVEEEEEEEGRCGGGCFVSRQ